MKTKLRLCRILCSRTLLLWTLCGLGVLECWRWLQQEQQEQRINTHLGQKEPLLTPRDITKEGTEKERENESVIEGATQEEVAEEAGGEEDSEGKVEAEYESSALPPVPPQPPVPHIHAPKKRRPKQNILLLAYARSGSSFTGELLSAGNRAAYYYEPLFRYRI